MSVRAVAGTVLGLVLFVQVGCGDSTTAGGQAPGTGGQAPGMAPSTPAGPAPATQPAATGSTGTPRIVSPPASSDMETAKAVVVTTEIDYGGAAASIPEAFRLVQRRYKPADGQGRTFAVLDAFGETAPNGNLLLSMHISTEKPGTGALIFGPTGQTIWEGRIVQGGSASPYSGKNLAVFINDGKGGDLVIDGSNSPTSILDAKVRDLGVTVREFLPLGVERDMTFVYSACGCPVHVKVKRTPTGIVRTEQLPIIFPDDPGAVATIKALMKW